MLNQYSNDGLLYSQQLTDEHIYNPGKRYLEQVFNSILESVEHVYFNLVDGEISEFGTGYGLTANMLSYSSKIVSQAYNYDQKEILFFDSFEGLPEIRDEADKKTPWKRGDFHAATSDDIRDICGCHLEKDKIKIYAGWFQETLVKLAPETRLSLVHIDSDLYESAHTVLHHLFTHRIISEGAVILFDDYNCNRASNNLGERKAWQEAIQVYDVVYSDLGSYSPFGWKFIIHSYSVR